MEASQLLNHLFYKLLKQHVGDQIGVIIDSDLPDFPGRFVLFMNGSKMQLLETGEEEAEMPEFSTVSYGPLN